MRKDVVVSMSFDRETARLLKILAEMETEGNCSLLLRQLLRAAAKVHGLEVSYHQTPQPFPLVSP